MEKLQQTTGPITDTRMLSRKANEFGAKFIKLVEKLKKFDVN